MADLESLYYRAGQRTRKPTTDVASAFVLVYGEWLNDTVRRCVASSETRSEAVRKLETALANRLNRDLQQAYSCASRLAIMGMRGTFTPNEYIDFPMMADVFIEDRWPRHLDKSDLKRRRGSRPAPKASKCVKSRKASAKKPIKKAPVKKTAKSKAASGRRRP